MTTKVEKNQINISSEQASSGGTTTSLVTTGEKYTWNNKLDASKVKSSTSSTSGDVYDVTYINTMLGNIETLLGGI